MEFKGIIEPLFNKIDGGPMSNFLEKLFNEDGRRLNEIEKMVGL